MYLLGVSAFASLAQYTPPAVDWREEALEEASVNLNRKIAQQQANRRSLERARREDFAQQRQYKEQLLKERKEARASFLKEKNERYTKIREAQIEYGKERRAQSQARAAERANKAAKQRPDRVQKMFATMETNRLEREARIQQIKADAANRTVANLEYKAQEDARKAEAAAKVCPATHSPKVRNC